MADTATIHGIVSGADNKPIFMIRVGAIQDGRQVGHTFTADDGSYSIDVPLGLITLGFDTSATLNNVRDWHPSVVADVDTKVAGTPLRCDRVLMRVGTATSDEACVDALAGYLYSLLWTERQPDAAYAEAAAARLSQMKMPSGELDQFRGQLRELFATRAGQM